MRTMTVGGIEKLLVTVSNELAKSNNVYLCVVSENYSQELMKKFDEHVHIVFLKKARYFRRINYFIQINRIIKKHNIETIHIHQPEMMVYYAPTLLCQNKIKKVVTIHDTGKMERIGLINRFLVRNLFDDIIAISEAVRREIINYKIPEFKVHKIYNAIELNEFQIRENSANKSEELVIGNVARVFPSKKGQDILIKAVAILASEGINVVCKFAGAEVKEGEIARMQNLAKTLNISDKIVFLGNVDNIASFLETIDIFVLPSRYEGFGISLIEAMAAGLPCISSNVPGANEIIIGEEYGLQFESENEEDLAQKLKHMINNRCHFNSSNIRRYVEHNFSVESMSKSLLEIYGGENRRE